MRWMLLKLTLSGAPTEWLRLTSETLSSTALLELLSDRTVRIITWAVHDNTEQIAAGVVAAGVHSNG